MFDEADRETGYALAIAIGMAIFVSILTIGIAAGSAIGLVGGKSASAARAGSVAAVSNTVRLYFEVGKAELPVDALSRLEPLIQAAARSHSTLVVSGYHDTTGDAAANAELARQRAFAVRDLLKTAGIGDRGIELAKPAVTTGGADAREARRVEVSLR